MRQYKWAYLMARLPIAMSMFGHGLVRLPKLNNFSTGMVTEFGKSFLPDWIIQPFSYVLPFAELLTGVLLLLGWFTRFGLFLGATIMLVLIFGSSVISEWQNVAIQMFYGIYFAVLFLFIGYNAYSVDGMSVKRG
jgi:thiosulfate dehydrogenase [quinone] large subunit